MTDCFFLIYRPIDNNANDHNGSCGYYHGHFNHKNIKGCKSVLECVEKRVSHSLLNQRFYCMVSISSKNLCITSLQRVRLRVVPIFPQR